MQNPRAIKNVTGFGGTHVPLRSTLSLPGDVSLSKVVYGVPGKVPELLLAGVPGKKSPQGPLLFRNSSKIAGITENTGTDVPKAIPFDRVRLVLQGAVHK